MQTENFPRQKARVRTPPPNNRTHTYTQTPTHTHTQTNSVSLNSEIIKPTAFIFTEAQKAKKKKK
jgi:hypothetical protein